MKNKLYVNSMLFVRSNLIKISSDKGELLWISYDEPTIELWKLRSKWTIVGKNCSFSGKAGESLQRVFSIYQRTAKNLLTMQIDRATGTLTLDKPLPKNTRAVITTETEF